METTNEKEITGVIYKFENKINGKIYIGLSRKERARYFGHIKCKKPIYEIDRAILHYGAENFDYSILESFSSFNLDLVNLWMDEKEVYYISYYDCMSPKGYNLLSGGNHPEFSEEAKKKISEAVTGEKNGFYGKKHTDDAKKKMSEKAKARPGNRTGSRNPQETIDRWKIFMKEWWTNYKDTDAYKEQLKKKSEQMKEYHKNHKIIYTDELKKHMSDSHKGLQLVYAKSRKVLYYNNKEFVCEFVNPAAASRYFKENNIDINIGAKLADKGFSKHPEIHLIYKDRINNDNDLLSILNISPCKNTDNMKNTYLIYDNDNLIYIAKGINDIELYFNNNMSRSIIYSLLNGNISKKFPTILINKQ